MMMKGLASDKLTKLRVAPHRFALLAALALGIVLGVPVAARSDGDALDVATLRVRLKDTPAIGLVEKLRLKSEIEDLVNDLAAFHAGRATETLDELHARYRDLVLRIIALLEQSDASLAHDLTAASDHLWATLADPGQFASLAKS
jgi:hypothetical protein